MAREVTREALLEDGFSDAMSGADLVEMMTVLLPEDLGPVSFSMGYIREFDLWRVALMLPVQDDFIPVRYVETQGEAERLVDRLNADIGLT